MQAAHAARGLGTHCPVTLTGVDEMRTTSPAHAGDFISLAAPIQFRRDQLDLGRPPQPIQPTTPPVGPPGPAGIPPFRPPDEVPDRRPDPPDETPPSQPDLPDVSPDPDPEPLPPTR